MNYEIIGESVKSAISIKLGELFDNPIRYKENITNMQYPNFFIKQLNSNVTPLQTKVQGVLDKHLRRMQIDYLFNIQYRLASDTEIITNLRQQLDAIGFRLITEFTEIDLDIPVYTKDCRYEIVDGVLHFFFNITLYVLTEEVEEPDMNSLEIQEEIEEEE